MTLNVRPIGDRILVEPIEEKEQKAIRRSLHTGRPLASDSFLSKLEHRLGRRLRPLPVGRPKKQIAKTTAVSIPRRRRKK